MLNTPILHMASPTHYANLMIRHMVATKLASFLPSLRISNIDLPYWGIHVPSTPISDGDSVCELRAEQHFPFQQIRYLAEADIFNRFHWLGYGQRMENFPSLLNSRSLFQTDSQTGRATSRDCIVCPIRGAEILAAIHPGYTIVPVAFYEELIEQTGLTPIFMGQATEDNLFTRRLLKRFPRAEFLPHISPLEDFQTIRKAHNILLPVSTFAWLAAWFSEADLIVLPVFGIFDPKMFSLNDLLPLSEPRYRFFEFPGQAAVPLDRLEDAHAAIKGKWREVSSKSLAQATI